MCVCVFVRVRVIMDYKGECDKDIEGERAFWKVRERESI